MTKRPPGRPPIGKQAMTGAERLRRYRAKLRAGKPETKSYAPETKPETKPYAPETKHETKLHAAETKRVEAALRAQLAERDREIAQLRTELQQAKTAGSSQEQTLKLRNEIERLHRQNMELAASNYHLRYRKGVMTRASFNHLKACLHPDSRGNFTDAKLTHVRTWIESLEKVLVKPDKKAK
jgi:hypothetical protein